MKKLIAGILAAVLCFSFAACDKTPSETSDTTTDTSVTTSDTTSSLETSCTETTSNQDTSDTTQQGTTVDPKPSADIADLEAVKIGSYVTLYYNGASADITFETKKGLGSKESVTVTATMKNDYVFDGWSAGNAIANGTKASSTSLSYTFDASAATKLYLNTSITLRYHENGGAFKNGFTGEETYSVVFFQNPNTRRKRNYIAKDGATLIGYNTKEDGTGEFVSLGAKVTSVGNGIIDLWCVWAENTPDADFETKVDGSGVSIVKYNGTADFVTIPEKIGGKTVVSVSANAFAENQTLKTVVIAESVKKVDKNAFKNCKALETIHIFDAFSYDGLPEGAFNGCDSLKTIHINTIYKQVNEWFSYGAGKLDRLMWAKDKKKIIIVGGSGSFYGFDCSILDDALGGEYEIINFGENANITAVMYFDIIEEFIGEGDIVLWCPEPGGWTLGSRNCSNRFWNFRKGDYGFAKYLNPEYYDNFFSSFAANCETLKSSKFKDFDALSNTLSKYGEDLADRQSKGERYSYQFTVRNTADWEMRELLQNIADKGGKVFYSYAAMQKAGMEYSEITASDMEAFEAAIVNLGNIEAISEYENYIFEDHLFSDSAWHMTDDGARERTKRVAEDILKALGK
ncbi:MAG: leucine-rich repeat protein [Clostridia bacterium]|nr:leucine-rich repeat protein [Clostridia bacterium]